MTTQLQKMLLKIPVNTHATISVMLLCWFVYTKALFGLEGWLKKTLQRKIIVMDSHYAYNLKKLKSDSNTSVFLWICKTFKNNYFVMFCRCFFLFCYFFVFFFCFCFCFVFLTLWTPLIYQGFTMSLQYKRYVRTLLKRYLLKHVLFLFWNAFLYGILLRGFFVTK